MMHGHTNIKFTAWIQIHKPGWFSQHSDYSTDWNLKKIVVQFSAVAFNHRPIQWMAVVFASEIKRPGREGDHFSPSSVEIKHEWSYTSATLPITNLSF